MAEGVSNAPTSAMPILFSRQVQPAYICLPSLNVECGMEGVSNHHSLIPHSTLCTPHLNLAARVGLAPTPCGLTNRRATLTPPGNGTAGRTSTCIVPFRRRMPHVFAHGSISNWSERQDWTSQVLQVRCPDGTFASRIAIHLRPPGPKVLAHGHKRSED
jgi:hypothetical protein